MRIQRQPRRSYWPIVGCVLFLVTGCAATLLVAVLLLLPGLPGIALQVVGFDQRGATDSVFQPAQPAPAIHNAVAVAGPAVLDLGQYGTAAVSQYDLITGVDSQGVPVAQLTLDEANLTALCHERTDLCSTGNNQIRNARIDLRPGGAIIYADMYVPQISTWQNLGAVVRVNDQHAEIVGVDINGTLYSPTNSHVSGAMTDLEHIANEILTQVALNAAGSRYTLDTIYIDDQTLSLILR